MHEHLNRKQSKSVTQDRISRVAKTSPGYGENLAHEVKKVDLDPSSTPRQPAQNRMRRDNNNPTFDKAMSDNELAEVFDLLKVATTLETQNKVESATKYYEAVYLLRRHIDRIPVADNTKGNRKRELLQQKSDEYHAIATKLMMTDDDEPAVSAAGRDDSDTVSALTYSPRSPLGAGGGSTNFYDGASEANMGSGGLHGNQKGSDETLHITNSAKLDKETSHANAKLAYALDLDENASASKNTVVAAYMESAELLLKAIQTAKQNESVAISTFLKRRLAGTLDRIETLKKGKSSASKSNNRALSVGQSISNGSTGASRLTQEEIEVLKKSSTIAAGLFLPWSEDDATKLTQQAVKATNSGGGGGTKFTDPDGKLQLSQKQFERFHQWARPSEILNARRQTAVLGSILKSKSRTPDIVQTSVSPYTIQQKFVTDCSFIASLCGCATLERKLGRRIVTSILYPQDPGTGAPLYNPEGKYMVKLWLNGVARAVVIDDYLPIDKRGNLLCSQTKTQSPEHLELWVCLIEKAYMKLCGGYDFPGSNSGVDLFSLTGWIPERILFAKDDNNVKDYECGQARCWDRIFSASSYGDCLITVSTQSELTVQEADSVGLVTGHAYAVLSVIQTSTGIKLLQLKNPWAHKSWHGRYSSADKSSWKDAALRREVGYNPDAHDDDGVFWICWEDILKYFKNFHLSWNPALFRTRLSIHGSWPKNRGPVDDTFNVGENPQFPLTLSDAAIKQNATLWILISRHVTKQEQTGSEAQDYLTVHIHRNNSKQERIWYPGRSGNCVLTGCYTNNPHVLVRYDVRDATDKHLSLVLSQYKKSNDLNYTVSCYCTEQFGLTRLPLTDLPHQTEDSGTWSTYSAGGPIGTDDYFKNPQFKVRTMEKCTLQLQLSTSTTVAGNLIVAPVADYGDRIERAIAEPIIDTGKYRHGFVASDRHVFLPGTYNITISNFHAGQTGLFNLKLNSSSSKVRMEAIK